MEVVFLDGLNLEIKDNAFCDTDYEIILDTVIPQKSKFTVNKVDINCEVGDLIYLKGIPFLYIGVITSLEKTEELTTTIQTKDFLSKFDIKVPVTSFTNKEIGTQLLNLIKENFYSTTDPHKKMSYLLFHNYNNILGSVTFDDDKLESIVDLNESWSKTFGARLGYELVLTNGKITNIRVVSKRITKGFSLRSNLGAISDLVINDSNEQDLNEIVFVPKKENTSHKDRISYCLLIDGTLSTNPLDENRPTKALFEYETYSDSDYDSLESKAKEKLIDSSLDHSITFKITTDNNTISPFRDFWLGDFANFISSNKVYETMVSQITFKETMEYASITLGEYRVKLTDKLKLLTRKGE